MKKYALLLDFDGVIAKSEHLYQKVEQKLFDAHDVKLSEDEWAEIKGISSDGFFRLIKEKYIPDADIDEIKKEIERNLLKVFQKELEYVAGFEKLLPQLKTQFKVAIVTATGRDLMEWTFKNTHVHPEVDLLITADDVSHSKPHPEPYVLAAKKLNIPITQCLVVEDSVNGLRSGKAAGAKVLAFTTSLSAGYLSEADYIAQDFNDISCEKIRSYINSGE